MQYSKSKFLSFNEVKQQKVLLEFIRKIEQNWSDKEQRYQLLKEFSNCLSFAGIKVNKDFFQSSLREFLNFSVPLERQFGKEIKDDDFLILKQDGERKQSKQIPLYLVLDNLRSSFNVGSIFRTAECFGVSKLILCGYTANPQNLKVQKTAMGTDKFVEWEQFSSTTKAIRTLKETGVRIYALETTSNAKNIAEIEFTKPCALILGNEALGISKEILKMVDEIVNIPVSGWKNSLNVGVTAAICCYEVNRQWRYHS
jgi:tRNA G18 (ribose-2'-O)-methylase SpoU